jgi:Phage tail assembly chaperone protein, TAC
MTFTMSAQRLAGLAGWLLHWTPDTFWAATPAELLSIFAAVAAPDFDTMPPDRATLARLKEMYPDG